MRAAASSALIILFINALFKTREEVAEAVAMASLSGGGVTVNHSGGGFPGSVSLVTLARFQRRPDELRPKTAGGSSEISEETR
jgi:hypothetical protein